MKQGNMKPFTRTAGAMAALALAAGVFLSPAHATPTLSIVPSAQDAATNSTASIGIYATDFTSAIYGVGLHVSFDPSLLTGSSYVVDPTGVMHTADNSFNDLSFGFSPNSVDASPGLLDLFFTADATAWPYATSATDINLLAHEQGTGDPNGFALATVTFATGLNSGLSPLTLQNVTFSDSFGTATYPNAQNGSICVGGACAAPTVPEPASYWLVGLGLIAVGVATRRRNGARAPAA